MKLEFKFSWVNLIAFILLGGVVYRFCPLPSALLGRAFVCAGIGVFLFGVCFVVVTHKSMIRPANPNRTKHKHKK